MAQIASYELPKIPQPKRLRIYASASPRATEKALLSIARRFGLQGKAAAGEVRNDAVKMSYVEGPYILTIYRATGALRFIDQRSWRVDNGRSEQPISDQKAIAAARKFISRIKLAPMRECRFLMVSHLHVASMSLQTREAQEKVIGLSVIFRRMINGVPADGSGGRVIVYLNASGNVTGYDQIWRPLRGSRAVKSVRSAQDIRHDLEQFSRRFGEDVTVEVLESRFGYFETGQREPQRVIQPAYVFILRAYAADPRVHRKSVFVTHAASNGTGPMTPQPAPRRPQRTRREVSPQRS